MARGVEDDSCYTSDTVDNLLNDGISTYGYDAFNRQIATSGTTNAYANSGTPSAPIAYDAWGTPEGGAVPPTFGFTGELQDVGTGMVNLRARWYTPGRGTFTSRDPFEGFDQQPYSLHPYQYASSNPVLNTDPSGLCDKPGEPKCKDPFKPPCYPPSLIIWLRLDCPPLPTNADPSPPERPSQSDPAANLPGGLAFPWMANPLTINPPVSGGGIALPGGVKRPDTTPIRDIIIALLCAVGVQTGIDTAKDQTNTRRDDYTTFYSVQNRDDVVRLNNGGVPWPTEVNRAEFGPGVYAWGNATEAERYRNVRQTRLSEQGIEVTLFILRFRVRNSVLASFRQIDVDALSDPDVWSLQYNRLYGGTANHGYQYIRRRTQFGIQHFFDASVMGYLEFY